MGLFGFGSKSNEEIIDDNWNEDDPAAFDVEAIVSTLDDDDPEITIAASKLLCAVADNCPERLAPHVEELRPGVEDAHDEVVANVTYSLTYAIESEPGEAVGPVLVAVMQNLSAADERVRQYSLNVVWQVATAGDLAAQSVASLHRHDLLRNVAPAFSATADRDRLRAAAVLREVSRVHPDVGADFVSELNDTLDDPDDEVATAAAAALSWVASDHRDAVRPAVEDLVAVLADCSVADGRKAAAGALSLVAEDHPEAVAPHADVLVDRATDAYDDVRLRSFATLRHVAEAAPDALRPHREVIAHLAGRAPTDDEREHAQACVDAIDAAESG